MDLKKYIGMRIKHFRIKKGMNQDQLAELLETTKQTVSRYENGERQANQDILFNLSSIFNISIDDFFPEKENIIPFPASSQYPKFPKVSAGLPIEIDGITEKEVETISIPDYMMGKWAGNKDIYITRTNGESMNRIIPHDSLIAVKRVELSELKDNDIVVYQNHGEYAVKRFERHPDKLVFRPDSTDRSFIDDVIYIDSAEDLYIKGKVVMWLVTTD